MLWRRGCLLVTTGLHGKLAELVTAVLPSGFKHPKDGPPFHFWGVVIPRYVYMT